VKLIFESYYFQYDTIIARADALVKETVVLRHYYTVSLARFKHLCTQGKLVPEGPEPSLEDCIIGIRNGVTEGASVQVWSEEETCPKVLCKRIHFKKTSYQITFQKLIVGI